jgi:hypothetical protein
MIKLHKTRQFNKNTINMQMKMQKNSKRNN